MSVDELTGEARLLTHGTLNSKGNESHSVHPPVEIDLVRRTRVERDEVTSIGTMLLQKYQLLFLETSRARLFDLPALGECKTNAIPMLNGARVAPIRR